ncbi:MAG TPA: oligosaccharide flippase family protein [Candidatus Sulfotelmatobacter sp.]|jgi:lipopolysaccharide exporter|nr:oligosaccharide flippase family protein [Candidatus Sulfotelmatobacter sp.]
MGYKRDTVKGVSWITLLRGMTRLLTFVRLAILGRLLTPTQFGFFGIATLLLSLLEILTETGINIFLVQEKNHIKEYVNSAWVVSIIRGIILALIIFIAAPFITTFFKANDAYLIIVLIALVPFIRGFINPAIISFQKDLLFYKEFRLRTILFCIDVFSSIIVGFITKNAISFDVGLIASAVLEVLLSYTLITLRPNLRFEYQKIKHVIHKGWWVTVTGIFSFFAENGDNITVGKILGVSSLGIYQVAYKFSTLPISEITNVVNMVVFPVYAKFSDDKERLWNAFKKVTILSSTGALIFGTAIFILAKPIILIFMGGQWVAAIPAIQILSVYGILRTVFGNFAPLFLAVHKQNYVAQSTFFRVGALVITVAPLVLHYGMVGAGFAMLISILAEIPIIIYFSHKVFKK